MRNDIEYVRVRCRVPAIPPLHIYPYSTYMSFTCRHMHSRCDTFGCMMEEGNARERKEGEGREGAGRQRFSGEISRYFPLLSLK